MRAFATTFTKTHSRHLDSRVTSARAPGVGLELSQGLEILVETRETKGAGPQKFTLHRDRVGITM